MVGVILLDIFAGLHESFHTLDTIGLVESEVGLVSHTVGGSSIDDEGIKLAEGSEDILVAIPCFGLVDDTLRNLVDICIETHAEKTLLLANLID
jgi:hypothetical protein